MTKADQQQLDSTILQKRRQISNLREELEDLSDYLDLLEARTQDEGKPTVGHEEMKERLGLK